MTEHFAYYDFDPEASARCPGYGWSGSLAAGDREDYRDLFDVSCPRCSRILAIVSLSTLDEMQAAAGVGDKRARRDLEGRAARASNGGGG